MTTAHRRLLGLALLVGLTAAASTGTAQVEAEFADEFDAPAQPKPQPQPQPQPTAQPAPAPQPQPKHETEVVYVQTNEHTHDAEQVELAPPEDPAARALRASNSWKGPVGGIHVIDAGSGRPGTFRLQLGVDFFSSSDFLILGDENDYFGGTLSLSWTVSDFLELYASLDNHANENTLERPALLQVLGDTRLGTKLFHRALPWLNLAGDVRLVVLNAVGDIGPVLEGTSVGFRASVSADLRELNEPVPLILRGNLGYFFDNSAQLIEGVEDARYEALGADRRDRIDEDRHLVRRVERFALGINRIDALTPALGLEAPLRAGDDFYIHPILEWWVSVPVNRQDYSCLLLPTAAGPGDPDGCLEEEGFSAMSSTLTIAARAFPPVRGLSFAAGVDIGVSGTSTFVRELAPNRPYAVLLAMSYAVDPAVGPAGPPEVREVVKEVVKEPPPKPRIAGTVADRATGGPIAGAAVRYVDLGLTTQQTDAAGLFTSYEMDPGQVVLEVSHPDYESSRCAVLVPEPTPEADEPGAAAPAAPTPPAPVGPMAAPPPAEPAASEATAASGGSAEGLLLTLRCELTALPKRGQVRGLVSDQAGKPVMGARVQIRGVADHDVVSDAAGQFLLSDVPAGNYTAQAEADGYLIKLITFQVPPRGLAAPQLQLLEKPKKASVQLTKQEVRIRKQIHFMTNSAEISARSHTLLSEIADVLLRNPHVKRVEVQGHTDNRGATDLNARLSQARAEAVRDWLVSAGIAPDRLTAKGYGDTRPLVPNITDRNRAKNRRVQFIIREKE
ncbi:MAG: OmpA family protein [Myxococcales bacterium]|nr:OmpA family protein [Myxococcales bacterium]